MGIDDRETRRARMQAITRTDRIDWAGMPSDYMSSADPRAVAYRRSLARASNAIEGVVLSEKDSDFVDRLPRGLSADELAERLKSHFQGR